MKTTALFFLLLYVSCGYSSHKQFNWEEDQQRYRDLLFVLQKDQRDEKRKQQMEKIPHIVAKAFEIDDQIEKERRREKWETAEFEWLEELERTNSKAYKQYTELIQETEKKENQLNKRACVLDDFMKKKVPVTPEEFFTYHSLKKIVDEVKATERKDFDKLLETTERKDLEGALFWLSEPWELDIDDASKIESRLLSLEKKVSPVVREPVSFINPSMNCNQEKNDKSKRELIRQGAKKRVDIIDSIKEIFLRLDEQSNRDYDSEEADCEEGTLFAGENKSARQEPERQLVARCSLRMRLAPSPCSALSSYSETVSLHDE